MFAFIYFHSNFFISLKKKTYFYSSSNCYYLLYLFIILGNEEDLMEIFSLTVGAVRGFGVAAAGSRVTCAVNSHASSREQRAKNEAH